MDLREEVHRSIDKLNMRELEAVYDHVQVILHHGAREGYSAPSLEELHALSKTDWGSWADEIVAEREDRL